MWKEVKKSLTTALTALINQLPEDPKARGDRFEELCLWFFRNDPYWRQSFERVDLRAKSPYRHMKADKGTDLIAKHIDGTLYAIQCKAYPNSSVTMHGMSQFMTDSAWLDAKGNPWFGHRILITAGYKVGDTAKKYAKNAGNVTIITRKHLEEAQVNWPATLGALLTPVKQPKPRTPRPDQRKATNKTVATLKKGGRARLLAPCGWGKTLDSLWIAKRLGAKRILVLEPRLLLVKQVQNEWYANTKGLRSLVVSSDDSAKGSDDVAMSMMDLGKPSTTNVGVVAEWLQKSDSSAESVLFGTYQSSRVIAEAMKISDVVGFDLIIADEAHYTAQYIGSRYATALEDKEIPAKWRLFMTATQKFFTNTQRREGAVIRYEFASMNDEKLYGPVGFEMTFGEAIQKGLLCDYRVYIGLVSDDQIHTRRIAQRGKWVHDQDDYDLGGSYRDREGTTIKSGRELAGQNLLLKVAKKFQIHRAVTSNTTRVRAKDFSSSLDRVNGLLPARQRVFGQIWAGYVTGEMDPFDRDRNIDCLRTLDDGKANLAVLSNVSVLTEGFDLPSLESVTIIDPRRSINYIVQMFGRALRIDPENPDKIATFIVPVYIGSDPDYYSMFNREAFRHAWRVLLALYAMDGRFADYVDALRYEQGLHPVPRSDSVKMPPNYILDVPKEMIDAKEFVRAFTAHFVKMATASFEETIGALEWYKKEVGDGDIDVPQDYVTPEDYPLGQALSYLRVAKREGNLAQDRIERLDALGMVWEPHGDAFKKGILHVQKYFDREKNVRIKKEYVDRDDDFPTGSWLSKQCVIYRRGHLSEDRTQQLEAMGVVLQGSRSRPKRLTDAQKQEIRQAYSEGKATQEELARQYGVKSVSQILHAGGIRNFHHLTDAEKQEILLAYTKKKTRKELAEQYGVSEITIYGTLRDKGVEFPRNKKLTDADKKQILRDYSEGKGTQRELAQQYGVSYAPIGKILREAGISRDKVITDAQKHEIRRAYVEKKMTQKDLARQYDVRQSSISRILRDMRVERSQKKLTDAEEQEIRLACAEKKMTQRQLAQQYGVSEATVSRIRNAG